MCLLYFNGGKINFVLYQMHLASLTEIASHCVFTDPQIIDYCNKENEKNANMGAYSPMTPTKESCGCLANSICRKQNKAAWWLHCDQIPCTDHFWTYIYTCSCKWKGCLTQLCWKENTRAGNLFLFWDIFHHLSRLLVPISTSINPLF